MMRMNSNLSRADLHIHTNCSRMDGLIKPKQLIDAAERLGISAIAITDTDAVHAFPEVWRNAACENVKVIFGVDMHYKNDVDNEAGIDNRGYRLTMLAKNQIGLKNMYQLISIAHLKESNGHPHLLKSEILKHRDGLLLGTGGTKGEVLAAICEKRDAHGLLALYDYVELLPCYGHSIETNVSLDENQICNGYRKLVALAKSAGKPFIIGSDARFLEPEDEEAWRILRDSAGNTIDAETGMPYWLKSSEELAEEFSYLGEEDCAFALSDNPVALADACEIVRPSPENKRFLPRIDGAEKKLRDGAFSKARQIYGSRLPEKVRDRIDEELGRILRQNSESLLLIAKELVEASQKAGYPVGTRGNIASSFVAFLLGITGINPLPPHYRCDCGYIEFIRNHLRGCGIDLPSRNCPRCGKQLIRDGYNIPYETLLGTGDRLKLIDIFLNFAVSYQKRAEQHLCEMFGDDHVIRAGSIVTLSEQRARTIVERYAKTHELSYSEDVIKHLTERIAGVMTAMSIHPGGWFIVPDDMTIEDVCPVQQISLGRVQKRAVTHFNCFSVDGCLAKIDLLGHTDMDMLGALAGTTGVDVESIPMADERTMGFFLSNNSFGDSTADSVQINVGTAGLKEFADTHAQKILHTAQPKDFESLIRVSGLTHGYRVWDGNAERLIEEGLADIKSVIGTRDDVFFDLCEMGIQKETAFAIMERVRKGAVRRYGLDRGMAAEMADCGVPAWYVSSMKKIGYLYPKAHCAVYTLTAYRLAWFKLYYPLEFYCALFNQCWKDGIFDVEAAIGGKEMLKECLEYIDTEETNLEENRRDNRKREMYQSVYKFLSRGFSFIQGRGGNKAGFAIEKGVGLRIPISRR